VRLARSFGGLHAVDRVSFSVPAGRMVGLIGPNGAGKSTLFDLVCGSQHADDGQILLEGRDITRLPAYARARAGLGRTFQTPRPINRLSVLENLLLGAPQQFGEHGWAPLVSPVRVEQETETVLAKADEILRFFELERVRDEYAGALSGGQKKLLDLARALMGDPRILLLDEPMAGINPSLARKLLDKIETIRTEKKITVLMVEHDLETVYERCDPILVMANGKLLAQGDAATIRSHPDVLEAYIGGG
jgi:branched-chain amino acid transport system ATP-binding protein